MHHRTTAAAHAPALTARPTSARTRTGLPSVTAAPIGLPPIGTWWTLLDRGLQREILANPTAPLRPFAVRRVFEICGMNADTATAQSVRLGANERAYIAGWAHAVDWT
ncbi:hypothetical protein [Agromyces sp. NPDC058110]|uniref:hypothetical protein n=1 Tax=Agromyces sp. NPDC058110 TaxID=3346345 RepID=UPI0036D8A3BF